MVNHSIFWLVISILYAFIAASPFGYGLDQYKKKLEEDRIVLQEELGEYSSGRIIEQTNDIYKHLFIDSGLQPWVYENYNINANRGGEDELTKASQLNVYSEVDDWLDTYIEVLFFSMYEFIFRFMQLLYWGAFSIPFVIAAAADGMMQRKLRSISSIYSSPSTYNLMWHSIISITALTLLYCNSPIYMPALFFPALIFVVAMILRSLLANLQRSA